MFIESQSFKPLLKVLKSSLLTVQKTSKKKKKKPESTVLRKQDIQSVQFLLKSWLSLSRNMYHYTTENMQREMGGL